MLISDICEGPADMDGSQGSSHRKKTVNHMETYTFYQQVNKLK